MRMQPAEWRVAFDHPHWRFIVETLDELLGRAVLDGVAAAIARKQSRAGKRGKNNRHGACWQRYSVQG